MDEGRIAFDLARLVDRELREARRPPSIHKGTRVLISLWDSLMFGRVPGTRVLISLWDPLMFGRVLEY